MEVKDLSYQWESPREESHKTFTINTYRLIKRSVDIMVSLISIIILSPVMLIISAIIRFTSEGPAIYKQQRVGYKGREFCIYKFRSMVNGADNLEKFLSPDLLEIYQKDRKLLNDPRITKVGKILRRTSLDELPQIFNIFKGDMSLVGPRPMLPEEIKMYGDSYSLYITTPPGLTGLWQILSRGKTTMDDRAKLDEEYLKNKSFAYDISILIRTVSVVLSKKGAC